MIDRLDTPLATLCVAKIRKDESHSYSLQIQSGLVLSKFNTDFTYIAGLQLPQRYFR